MIRAIVKISGTLTTILGSVVLIIFGEGLLVSSIIILGIIQTYIIFTSLFFALSLFILYVYISREKAGNKLILVTRKWIDQKEKDIFVKKQRLLKYGKIISTLLLGITVGPLPTTVYICLVGFPLKQAISLVLINNVVFFTLWIAIYSGGIRLLTSFFS